MAKEQCSGIWIVAEQENGCFHPTVAELLTKAQELKKHSGETVSAILMGENVRALCQDLISLGADQVILCEHPNLEQYKARTYQQALTALNSKYHPSIILYGATEKGCDLAPRMMVALSTGLTADAVELGYDEDGDFYQVTPGYGGKLFARIVIPEKRPQMATVHAGICEAAEADPERRGQIITEELDILPDPEYEVLSVQEKPNRGRSLQDADVIISGGRGIQTEKDLELLQELAALLNGQVAGSRPLVDKGLLPHEVQIGQSGKTVRPKLILNVAISGSVQYRVGMQKSGCIVCVNQAPKEPIFELSNYGIVEDYRAFLPAVIEEIRRRRDV